MPHVRVKIQLSNTTNVCTRLGKPIIQLSDRCYQDIFEIHSI
jgi:hypothetical protein